MESFIGKTLILLGVLGLVATEWLEPSDKVSRNTGREAEVCGIKRAAGIVVRTSEKERQEQPCGEPGLVTWDDIVDFVWWKESRCGKDAKCSRGVVGPAGERGQFQITPIFERDVKRISGMTIDIYDNESCRQAIVLWLAYYGPRCGAKTISEYYELYRRGPSGYRKWKEARTE